MHTLREICIWAQKIWSNLEQNPIFYDFLKIFNDFLKIFKAFLMIFRVAAKTGWEKKSLRNRLERAYYGLACILCGH
jgi:hypothetical protein